jgi:hypothetical protein
MHSSVSLDSPFCRSFRSSNRSSIRSSIRLSPPHRIRKTSETSTCRHATKKRDFETIFEILERLERSVGRLTQLKRSNRHFASSSRPSPPFCFVQPSNAVLQQKNVTFQVTPSINDFSTILAVLLTVQRIFEYMAGQRSSKQRQAQKLVVLDKIVQILTSRNIVLGKPQLNGCCQKMVLGGQLGR